MWRAKRCSLGDRSLWLTVSRFTLLVPFLEVQQVQKWEVDKWLVKSNPIHSNLSSSSKSLLKRITHSDIRPQLQEYVLGSSFFSLVEPHTFGVDFCRSCDHDPSASANLRRSTENFERKLHIPLKVTSSWWTRENTQGTQMPLFRRKLRKEFSGGLLTKDQENNPLKAQIRRLSAAPPLREGTKLVRL